MRSGNFDLLFKDMKEPLVRTWIEISRSAARENYWLFRRITGKKTRLWAVVKSNAYGHGIYAFSKLADELGVDGFCVDSIIEGLSMRREGIRKPILVLGPTLPAQLPAAEKAKIVVSVSTIEDLKELSKLKDPPEFHLKIDTGMHRRGFYVKDMEAAIKILRSKPALKNKLTGVFTHFASAKDVNYPTYTEEQFKKFNEAAQKLRKAGFHGLLRHVAATGGTLVDKKYHLDAVRVGIGLYGFYPSRELEVQLGEKFKLRPVLSWRAIITEIKELNKGDFVGYDLTERITKKTKGAIIPVGYWHGFPRAFSSIGEVLINGRRAKVLGRVSMDIILVDATGINCKVGSIATLIGKSGQAEIAAPYLADRIGASHYEFITRLNPLMERRETN